VLAAAQERLARRAQARALLASDPALAGELVIGRPDRHRQYDDGGLVDVNNVPTAVLAWCSYLVDEATGAGNTSLRAGGS